jgi:hypothetical protein
MFPSYPITGGQGGWVEIPAFEIRKGPYDSVVPYDDALDYNPDFSINNFIGSFGNFAYFNGQTAPSNGYFQLTNDPETTFTFGKILDVSSLNFLYPEICIDNPINVCAGDLYNYGVSVNRDIFYSAPQSLNSEIVFDDNFHMLDGVGMSSTLLNNTNTTSYLFNIILTENKNFALKYLNTGELPPDAILYPLDWENLPEYDEGVPSSDIPDDNDDDNTPEDDTRDIEPLPLETPTNTINQLTNYNWYWLSVPEWTNFLNWFWNDIGDFSDFDDIIAKVKGLYNDLASAVIMCRYYPVDYEWITRKRLEDVSSENIKLGMIEKAGAVKIIDQEYPMIAHDIGNIHISQKYKSFMDLSPYSQLSLYLPFHGFIDLDINLFCGHDLYVKALYDYMSGTIQYYIYYDNKIPVNTVLCKMAMDIPITLQTKNDRDSAIFNNVSSTIGGLVGAGVGIASGNPIGMVMGVTQGIGAFNSANASAPMRLMGNVGESGAYLGPQNCYIVIRRPTIQASNGKDKNTQVQMSATKNLKTWRQNVGHLCGYGYKLNDLSGKGFTVCQSPRINFTSTTPLQTEVDEIYDYLSKGVIL